jgi:stalled ribosome alternative rescue factor ArfA
MKVKRKRKIKYRHELARTNKEGLMNSASREHRVKKGKGSFRRRKKHQKRL